MKTCENCKTKHSGEYGSGRFCSTKCSRGFSTKAKRKEINKRVSETLLKPRLIKKCVCCCKDFEVKKQKQKNCSVKCSNTERWKDNDYKAKMSIIASRTAYEKHTNPDIIFGWRTRTKFKMSYPEKIAHGVLKDFGIEFEYEYPFHPYFIDFAILKYKIAIEIDGKQHELPERMEKDKKKDSLLLSKGWIVYRIKYPSENIKETILSIMASIPSA